MKASVLKWELRKAKFLDRPAVKFMAGVAHKVLSRWGAYVRRDVRGLLRKKGSKKNPSSKPGDPPYSPTRTLRDWVLFDYDAQEMSVTVGPEKLNIIFFDGDGKPVSGTVPETLEYGGRIRIFEALYRIPGDYPRQADGTFAPLTEANGKWMRADLRSRRRLDGRPTRMRTVDIAARPYMAPAFNKNLPTLRNWRRAA